MIVQYCGDDMPEGLFENDTLFRSDAILLEQAIQKGWDIPDKVLKKCPLTIIKILKNKESTARERLRAIEVLVKMRQQNLDQLPRSKKRRSITEMIPAGINGVRQQLLKDEKFLEECRRENNSSNDDTRLLGENS